MLRSHRLTPALRHHAALRNEERTTARTTSHSGPPLYQDAGEGNFWTKALLSGEHGRAQRTPSVVTATPRGCK
jgi:hypothetical protein